MRKDTLVVSWLEILVGCTYYIPCVVAVGIPEKVVARVEEVLVQDFLQHMPKLCLRILVIGKYGIGKHTLVVELVRLGNKNG